MRRGLITSVLLLLCGIGAIAQIKPATISGKVSDKQGKALAFTSVVVDTLQAGTSADENGNYELGNIQPGTYTLTVTLTGYRKQTYTVKIRSGDKIVRNFTLLTDENTLEEVTVDGAKNEGKIIKETGFNVNVIETKKLANVSTDINQILNRSTGIRIRENGGLGSDFTFSLNGYSGNKIRFFVDGLPATISFNNFPVNLIERIEVYKGVVPISLGADALGGAVNIITASNVRNFIDASYSYGSFNTHRAAVVTRNRLSENVVLNTDFFFNHSDNNFTVQAQLLDDSTNKLLPPQPFKRFNSQFTSWGITTEGGIINKSWADRLLVGVMLSGSKKHLQQGNSMNERPSGKAFQTGDVINGTLKYEKNNFLTNNLNAKISALYSISEDNFIDTVSRIYEWDGSYVIDPFGYGEYGRNKTTLKNQNKSLFNTATLQYILGEHHSFQLNNTFSLYSRKTSDALAPPFFNVPEPSKFTKNTLGLSYTLSLMDNRWTTIAFVKKFYMAVSGDYVEDGAVVKGDKSKVSNYGQGIASAFFITKALQLKASYEYTSRLPENEEILGSPPFILPNRGLVPEQSHNANLAAIYGKRFGKQALNAEIGLVYRKPENFIRTVVSPGSPFAQYQNLEAESRIMGIEGELRYSFNNQINIGINATYQDIRYRSKIYRGFPDPLYNNRLPNIPHLFGNADIGFYTKEFGTHKYRAGINWSTSFIEWFYLRWESQGQRDLKFIVPQQLTHGISFLFSAKEGRYNLSLSCLNIADAELYDNFRVQKPGRNYNAKFRVYIDRIKQLIK